MTRTTDLYLAFADGALTYDCPPCGKCCRGYGMGGDLVRIGGIPEVRRLAAFLDEENTRGPLASFFTYADGCRYQGDDNLCDIHRARGAPAKPRICRLFPFSKLADVDGLWTVLPHHRCPWTAAAHGADPLSRHAAILADLDNDDGTFLDGVTPTPIAAVTPLPAGVRRRLEERIRAQVDRTALDGSAAGAIAVMQAAQAEALPDSPPVAPPADRELWLDLLRCAGPPPPLLPADERLLNAALPALRVELLATLPLSLVPVALAAFALWLRSLAELDRGPLSGEDLLALLDRATPLLRILAAAEQPLPTLAHEPPSGASPAVADAWEELCLNRGSPRGEILLAALRPHERGALTALHQLGELLPVEP